MNLTEAKLKELILETMDDTEFIQKAEKQAQEAKYPEVIVQSIELLKSLGDPRLEGIEAEVIRSDAVTISGDYFDRIANLIDELGLQAGAPAGLKGNDGKPFMTVVIPYPHEEESEEEGGEDAPYDDGSSEWKSTVRRKLPERDW